MQSMTLKPEKAWPGRIRAVSILLIVAALVLLIRALPVERILGAFQGWLHGLGVWGPAIFAAVYAVWAVLFLPGAALTLAGGAVFGLWTGTATVLVGATVGAAFSFLIGRYLARDKVAAMARRNPKFSAIDRAVGQGGWKIVAMLRLSPLVPFNLQNYLYGVTAIRFWPCVVASFVFMAPGTFMYVYLGHLAGQGLAAAAGGGEAKSPGQWALLGVGLLATIAVTVYVTKLANRALAEQTHLDEGENHAAKSEPQPPSIASAAVFAVAAMVLFGSALYAYAQRHSIAGLFGPPPVAATEKYDRTTGGPDVDHSPFTKLLAAYVSDEGWVDYRGLGERSAALDAYLATLAAAPFERMGRDQKLALLINAYNAFTLRLILDHYPVESIRDIPARDRWDAKRWPLAGETVSLNEIEHERIRKNFVEPRIHFALVCAAVGCPKLRNEAYTADRLDEQLEDQTRYVHSHDRWFAYDAARGRAAMTQLYQWYGGDFKQQAGSALAFAARYSPELDRALQAGEKIEVDWLDYDWSLNEKK